ncbi:MAG: hypothetical protein FJX20_15490 [Alphaproteobacteria bacterium]|nr:hypothetical protein [Alphaproteobacteria bacterium]
MVSLAPLPPDDIRKMYPKAGNPAKALKTNIAQMRKAFQEWKITKSNAQLEPLLIEVVESVDSIYTLLKKHHPAEFQ